MYISVLFFQGEESNFRFDRDFESMEELSESMSDEDEEEQSQVIVDQSPYRFMNGNDGMGMLLFSNLIQLKIVTGYFIQLLGSTRNLFLC